MTAIHRWRYTWPILDPDMTIRELIAEALEGLPAVIAEEGVIPVGRHVWDITHEDPPHLTLETLVVLAVPAITKAARAAEVANRGGSLVDYRQCDTDGCDMPAGTSGLCSHHRTVRNNARARRGAAA